MNRALIFALIILCMPLVLSAQNGHWEWANTALGILATEAKKVAVDNDGNVYVTGSFDNAIRFDGADYHSKGGSDIFLVKYDSKGKIIWAETIGGIADDAGTGIAVDAQGNILLTGDYSDSVQFGSMTLSSFGDLDVFTVKYNSSGTVLWARSGGSIYRERAADIRTDKNGNIYIAGEFGEGSPSPKPDTTFAYFNNDTILGMKGSEIYLVKYNAQGDVLWSKGLGGSGNTGTVGGIFVDDNSNVIIGGSFGYYLDLDHIILLSNAKGFVLGDMFIAKYDSNGNAIWAKSVSGENNGGHAGGAIWRGYVVADNAGDVYITGSYLDCDMLFPGTTLSSTGSSNVYFAKYSGTGDFQWARKVFYGFSYSNGIATDGKDNILITGTLTTTGRLGKDSLVSAGGDDVFIAKYDKQGNDISGVIAGGSNRDYANSIAIGPDGTILVAGAIFSNPAKFGVHSISSAYNKSMFVAKFQGYPTGVSTTGSLSSRVDVYPNPTRDLLYVNGVEVGTQIKVLNALGQEVYSGNANSPKIVINTSELLPGIYILHLTKEHTKTTTHRFVKE